ncbi:GATA zinc finger domain-containing protein 14-like [Symsagittifera roscoffensis]|uniref:GATA zinc finger domain-containing protein 14-like n=1 Tax=Symsagittifera roscoffensis TaxID=84072 RepID=UPI00307CBFE8
MSGGASDALLKEGVWLGHRSATTSEGAFFCAQAGTLSPPTVGNNPHGSVHFDKSAKGKGNRGQNRSRNNSYRNRRDSKSPNSQQNHQQQNGSSHGHKQNGVNYHHNNYWDQNQYYSHHNHNYIRGSMYQGAQRGSNGPQYHRNQQFYSSHHQQFGELKQHIADARQTIQRALRHSGNRNSWGDQHGGGYRRSGGSRNNSGSEGSWGGNRRGGRRDSRRNSQKDQQGQSVQNNHHQQNHHDNSQNKNKGTKRTRTVSFGDTVSEQLSGRIRDLESENSELHKLTEKLESKVTELLDRVQKLEVTHEVQ